MLDVRRVQILVEVVRCGSFTAAARALSYTPSAVSQQIASLEREAGVTLVVRGPRGVVLTDPGRVLVASAGEVLGRLAAAERELQALAGLGTGRLRLGWFATAGATLMPRAMAEFGRRHPGIRLELLQGDPDECQAMLGALELELALVYQFDLEPDLEQVPLLQDPLHIGLPPGHALAGQTRVRLADLAGERWIQGVRQGRTSRSSRARPTWPGSSPRSRSAPTTAARSRGWSPPGSVSPCSLCSPSRPSAPTSSSGHLLRTGCPGRSGPPCRPVPTGRRRRRR